MVNRPNRYCVRRPTENKQTKTHRVLPAANDNGNESDATTTVAKLCVVSDVIYLGNIIGERNIGSVIFNDVNGDMRSGVNGRSSDVSH